MGGSPDDSYEARTNESRQPLCQHSTRWRQPDDLTSPRLTVTFQETAENIPVDKIKPEETNTRRTYRFNLLFLFSVFSVVLTFAEYRTVE